MAAGQLLEGIFGAAVSVWTVVFVSSSFKKTDCDDGVLRYAAPRVSDWYATVVIAAAVARQPVRHLMGWIDLVQID